MGDKKPFYYLYAILIIVLTWPLFAAWIPSLVKSWYWYPVGVVFGFFYISEYFRTKQIMYVLWYILVVYLNCFWGDKYIYDPIVATSRFLGLIFITSAPFFFLRQGNEKIRGVFYKIFLFLLIVVSIASYYWNIQFPNVIRDDITITGTDELYEFSYLYKLGLTRYQFAHAVPILIPPLVMAYKKNNKRLIARIFYAFTVFLCLLHTYVSSSTTAFMMAVIAVVLSVMISPDMSKNQGRRLIMVSVFLLPLLTDTVSSNILGFLDWTTGSSGAIHDHIVDVQNSIVSDSYSGTVGARQNRYNISWHMFFSNPLTGTNDEPGNHSIFIDHLGTYGLLGFIPFFALLWGEFKYVLKKIDNNSRFYYFISGICAFFMMALKNVSYFDMCCFLYVAAPVFFLQLNRDNSKKQRDVRVVSG